MKKITFVMSEVRLHEQLSIMALSAVLKKAGHASSLVFFQNDPFNMKKVLNALRKEPPDIVALSFMSSVKGRYVSLARHIKDNMDVPVIAGGPAATFDHALACGDSPFDAVCIGEGDSAIVDFADGYAGVSGPGPIGNFIIRTPDGWGVRGELKDLVEPLDGLPFPDRKIIYDRDDLLRNSKIKMFVSGRGCPYKCTYCFNHKYNLMYKGKGRIIRHKSVDYFLEEIEEVKKDYPMEGIIFEDDIFIMSAPWLAEFAVRYPSRIGLPYMCYVRPNLVTVETARLLRTSGCYSVRVAVECGNETIRNKILKRNLTDEEIIRSCRILHDEGLKVGTINILGLPTETRENMEETLKLNRACMPEHVSANMFMPLPGVDLTRFAVEQGLLDKDFTSPRSTHHKSEMKYPEEVGRFLYPFKALFPLLVKNGGFERAAPFLMKMPGPVLNAIDAGYRLRSNSKFYPPVRFSMRDKWRALYRYLSIALH